MKIAILGAGAWGTALAINLSSRHQVTLWTNDPQHLVELSAQRLNQRFLPDFKLPETLHLTATIEVAVEFAELVIVVVPVAGFRETLRKIVAMSVTVPIIWGCKGFESQDAKLPHQIAREELPENVPCGVFSGPSFAQEVAQSLPTAMTFASHDETFSQKMAAQLHSARLRVYSSMDVVGVEVGGAIKNVISIAAGISDGMGFGHNARAALMTRGLMEITRLGVRLGGRMETFMGLSGVGDLILTCTGDLSRNRRVGLMLAAGQSITEILQQLGHVAEGVYAAREVQRLGEELKIEMPIAAAVCSILYENNSAKEAVTSLLNREPKTECDYVVAEK